MIKAWVVLSVVVLTLVLGAPRSTGQARGPVPIQTEDLKLEPERPAGSFSGSRAWVAFDGETAFLRSSTTAWIFVRQGGSWSEQAELAVPCAGPKCGAALSGDTLALLATGIEIDAEVRVFVRDGTTWTSQLTLTEVPHAWGLDLEDDTLVVASTGTDAGPPGAAYVYVRDGLSWNLADVLVASEGTADHRMERAALSGDTIVVRLNDIPFQAPFSPSIAAIFVRDGSTWSEQASLPANGVAVAIDGDTLLLRNRILVREGTAWSEQAVLVPQDPQQTLGLNDSAGVYGNVAIIGSFEPPFGGEATVHVFVRSGATWTQQVRLMASDLDAFFWFGSNAVVHGNTVITGAGPAAYVFSLELPECFLVIGDDPGASPFVGGSHIFSTQVGPDVVESHAVLLDDIPAFVLPVANGLSSTALTRGAAGSSTPTQAAPEWMHDGAFAVQVLMWNPEVFPAQPEQWSAGLAVTVSPDGQVTTQPYGAPQGGLSIWAEVGQNAAGQAIVRFPFSIDGL